MLLLLLVHLRSRLVAPVVLALLSFSALARAGEPSEVERARTLFDEAGELERQGQWSAAQDRLRAALRLRETPHLRYALGWALENGGRLIDARTEYEVALRLAQRAGAVEVSHLAALRIPEIDRKIPLLQVHVRGALARDTHVLVDGREMVVHGDVGTMPVDPGTRIVRVERSGQSATEEQVVVTEGVFRVIEVKGDLPGIGEEPPPRSASHTTLPWALVATGGAFVASSIVLFASSASDASTRDEQTRAWCDATACVNGGATRAETADASAARRAAYDAASRGNTKQVVGAILGGVGLVGLATGTYLLVRHGGRERTDASRAPRVGLRFDAAPLPGGAMGAASVAF